MASHLHPHSAPMSGAGRCPFSHAAPSEQNSAPGCPVSPNAAAFDPFDPSYLLDPAEILRWSRDQEPVFYSPKLGYWVVSRYEDVKAVFRDNITFSPSNALEKITPSSLEAEKVLKQYNYAMARTLVNEDEPAHMERRRALMFSFSPEELLHHEPMVRKLVREYVDRFIDRGEADLVNEMLWEVPLTIALHFLGVPEEDMGTLRQYSIAHTVNTWGRPTADQQIEVAESVGKFWEFAGQVLEKMREDPSGHGWMKYAIRCQKEMPEVVTDSYLHSMMMAGIVAAHETTAHASANAIRLLLENRSTWEKICADPALIPNAVEECLRHSGSIVAWRRLTMLDAVVGGVHIPKGSKVLMVSASANHDERHFEDPDALDIYRDNASEHLSFGYGSHQCLGKNLARMELCIFLEELTKRLPHMQLVEEQQYKYLPNVSFRGPESLLVTWDARENPEKKTPETLSTFQEVKIGAPSSKSIFRSASIAEVSDEAEGIIGITIESSDGKEFPAWSAGAHIDLLIGEYSRKYSLCGDPNDRRKLKIAVLREPNGRGGSNHIHDHVRPGLPVKIKGPKNNFRLDESARHHVLIAGGIGITPIIAMADRLKALGKSYEIHYAGQSRTGMAFIQRLEMDHGGHSHLYVKEEGQRANLASIIGKINNSAQIYSCGPDRMIQELEILSTDLPENSLHFEHFSVVHKDIDPALDAAFDIELAYSGMVVNVAPGQTALGALRSAGFEVPSDCEEGLCGNCEVTVIEGEIDHRDSVLTATERAEGKRIITCCSRAKGKIKLAL